MACGSLVRSCCWGGLHELAGFREKQGACKGARELRVCRGTAYSLNARCRAAGYSLNARCPPRPGLRMGVSSVLVYIAAILHPNLLMRTNPSLCRPARGGSSSLGRR